MQVDVKYLFYKKIFLQSLVVEESRSPVCKQNRAVKYKWRLVPEDSQTVYARSRDPGKPSRELG